MVPRGHLGSLALWGEVSGLWAHCVSFPSSPPGLLWAGQGSPYPLLPGGQGGPAGEKGWGVSFCDVATLLSAQEVLVWDEGWPLFQGLLGASWRHRGPGATVWLEPRVAAQWAVEAWRKASDPDWLVRDFLERVRSKLESEGGLEFFRWERVGRVP